MSEQQRARELRATIERDIPATLDLWPTIRQRTQTQSRQQTTPPLRRWRPLGPALAASLLLLALFGAALLRPGQAPPVGAAEIISQARAADQATRQSYHLTATYTNAISAESFVVEHWEAADGRMFDQSTRTASDGRVTVQGLIDTGQASWFVITVDGQTTVQYTPQSKAALSSTRPGPPSLAQWLGAEGNANCSTARREPDTTLAGRSAYLISLSSTGACSEVGEPGDRSLVWIDQETYQLLGTANYGPDGTLREQYTVTAIEYGPVPESLFAYTPPAGATVCALEATPGYTLCQGDGQGRPTPVGPSLEPTVARDATDAQLALLNLTPETYKRSIGNGKTIADIARERGIDPAQLREAMRAAGQSRIDTLVSQHALTNDEATTQTALLTTWLDSQFNAGAPTPNQP